MGGSSSPFLLPQAFGKKFPFIASWVSGAAFGSLFVLALFFDSGPGSIGQRAKSFLLAIITGAFAAAAAVSQLGPSGLGGYAVAVMMGLFSLAAMWEVISGRPGVTKNS